MSSYTKWPGRYTLQPSGRYAASLPLVWDLGRKGSGLMIIVPTEFEHDVTVPAGLRWLIDPHDPRYQRAARLHDFLLAQGWDAWTAAAVFHQALKADRVGLVERWAMSLFALAWTAWRRR